MCKERSAPAGASPARPVPPHTPAPAGIPRHTGSAAAHSPDSALPSAPPLARGSGSRQRAGKGLPERRNPGWETSGQQLSLLLRTKPVLPSLRADADFKDRCSADFV